MSGVPLKVDRLGYMGTVQEVIEALKSKSEGMSRPAVVRLDDTIAIFDIALPDIVMPKVDGVLDVAPEATIRGSD